MDPARRSGVRAGDLISGSRHTTSSRHLPSFFRFARGCLGSARGTRYCWGFINLWYSSLYLSGSIILNLAAFFLLPVHLFVSLMQTHLLQWELLLAFSVFLLKWEQISFSFLRLISASVGAYPFLLTS
ncbi:hypothetical protein BS47DRAFT_834237 [Hydnum rufescens UP504]|uniref:Uncharacterized protein n=1 Tax=Hydnum rufescens UP504 TaxID=1448309 RepID=A0A9P6DYF9_9AGAM|nr:hypothetical protein BS47DRAFT_834237 [Hydnum rufescens UP504]